MHFTLFKAKADQYLPPGWKREKLTDEIRWQLESACTTVGSDTVKSINDYKRRLAGDTFGFQDDPLVDEPDSPPALQRLPSRGRSGNPHDYIDSDDERLVSGLGAAHRLRSTSRRGRVSLSHDFGMLHIEDTYRKSDTQFDYDGVTSYSRPNTAGQSSPESLQDDRREFDYSPKLRSNYGPTPFRKDGIDTRRSQKSSSSQTKGKVTYLPYRSHPSCWPTTPRESSYEYNPRHINGNASRHESTGKGYRDGRTIMPLSPPSTAKFASSDRTGETAKPHRYSAYNGSNHAPYPVSPMDEPSNADRYQYFPIPVHTSSGRTRTGFVGIPDSGRGRRSRQTWTPYDQDDYDYNNNYTPSGRYNEHAYSARRYSRPATPHKMDRQYQPYDGTSSKYYTNGYNEYYAPEKREFRGSAYEADGFELPG